MIEQRTPEWYRQRCGKITASRISAVLAKSRKSGEASRTRDNYRAQLVLERMTGIERESGYQSKAMERGADLEPDARAAYDTKFDVIVESVGFVPHPTILNAGCSPDGFVGDKGILQIKCPYPATHMEWLMRGGVPVEHRPQMAFELSCCDERDWNDFVSYCPDMPEHLRLFVARMTRDSAKDKIEEIEREVVRLDAEVAEMIRHLPSGKSQEELLQASIEAVPRKAKIAEVVTRAKEDPTTITQEDVEFAKDNC